MEGNSITSGSGKIGMVDGSVCAGGGEGCADPDACAPSITATQMAQTRLGSLSGVSTSPFV